MSIQHASAEANVSPIVRINGQCETTRRIFGITVMHVFRQSCLGADMLLHACMVV